VGKRSPLKAIVSSTSMASSSMTGLGCFPAQGKMRRNSRKPETMIDSMVSCNAATLSCIKLKYGLNSDIKTNKDVCDNPELNRAFMNG